jgi:3-dehydroquinate synthase
MKQFTVHARIAPYAVCFGRGILSRAGTLLASLEEVSSLFLLSSPKVFRHWGRAAESSLRELKPPVRVLFDDSERAKNLRTVERLCRALARAGADRRSLLVALGGGVVGDVAGYVAASYARGIRVVHVPTTLVAQLDSSIGGKTGVNLPEGKNLVGAFHPPRLVVADPQLLRTLPARQFRSGVYEAIKYGVIGDEMLFSFLERRMDDVLRQQPAALDRVLERCIRAKAEIVSQDEHESGLRLILNFGHTVGHALESATRYRRFLHGEAVGWGMMAAAEISVSRGLLPRAQAERICRLVKRVGTLPALPETSAPKFKIHLQIDKKAVHGELRMILARKIGQVEVVPGVEANAVIRTVQEMAKVHGRAKS